MTDNKEQDLISIIEEVGNSIFGRGDNFEAGCSEENMEDMSLVAQSLNKEKSIRCVREWQWWDLILTQDSHQKAFKDAGSDAESIQDILDLGVYLTTAVKCGKTGYGLKASTIKECSLTLEKELALFEDVKVYMLMGDVSIKAINHIAKRSGEGRVIPAGSTYKIRGGEYFFKGRRAFPSYEKSGLPHTGRSTTVGP